MRPSIPLIIAVLVLAMVHSVSGQDLRVGLPATQSAVVEVINPNGKVHVTAISDPSASTSPSLVASSSARQAVIASDVSVVRERDRILVEVKAPSGKRIDLDLSLPSRCFIKVRTGAGEVKLTGPVASARVETDTGTIATDIPTDSIRYDFLWTESRPRYLSDFTVAEVREGRAGRFTMNGFHTKGADARPGNEVSLNFSTGRGIVLLNVAPGLMPSNMNERPLTNAAKAIVRSGDSLLTEAIRRASPKYFGEYAKTLPPLRRQPSLVKDSSMGPGAVTDVRKVTFQVVDTANRAVGGLGKDDFEIVESGESLEVLSVEQTTAPFDLVLLLDVSGSVENYVDFIRDAALSFVETMDKKDRISIVIFNDDVKVISRFTSDRGRLTESLESFDAGGGTAYYDALAFVLADQLKGIQNDRTAIVVLSDGDDNQSFLPFDSLMGSTQESGALIYPLYVPSGLIVSSRMSDVEKGIDPLRSRFMSLTSKAEAEGARLAELSGGVYYPIRKLGEIQLAYDDIVNQLRTAYTVTYRSENAVRGERKISPRTKVKVRRENVFVKVGVAAPSN
jgi:VWFA-related protein